MKFTFYWLDGKRNVFVGNTSADALNNAGFGNGALRALDFYTKGDNHEYTWNIDTCEWDLNAEGKKRLFG